MLWVDGFSFFPLFRIVIMPGISRYHGVNLHNVWYRGAVEFVPSFAVASLRDSPFGSRTVCFANRYLGLELRISDL
ncbi:hypothetical protein FGF68_10340 [Prosthecochloris vibrioformis]|uniref:Uncharacterized protein n=1 Tax=Prosthecochloris vibrioformis TaxID=1098 RepID=A0A5C4RST1_PROVB|nr:hypothetical protein FGF68_10340 [Prosthecochloris vibrioformis]